MSSIPESRHSIDILSAAAITEESSSTSPLKPPQTPLSPVLSATTLRGQTDRSTRITFGSSIYSVNPDNNRASRLIPNLKEVGHKVVNRIRKFSGIYVTPETAQVYQAYPHIENMGNTTSQNSATDISNEENASPNNNRIRKNRFLELFCCSKRGVFCCMKRDVSKTKNDEEKKKEKKEKNLCDWCLIIILIIILLSLWGNVIFLDLHNIRLESPSGNNTTITTTTPINTPNDGDRSIKSLVCLSLFEGMVTKDSSSFSCEYCTDDPTPFYNVTQYCVLKGISSNAVNGSKFESEAGWLANNNFCKWLGITCDQSNNIIEINLINPNIPGTIGSDIGKIKTLQKLSILGSNSQPIGALPQSIFELKDLTSLSLTSTNINGPLPDKFDRLTSLKNLVLLRNKNFGNNIPPSIATLSLTSLIYSGQGGSGNIPDFIGNSNTLQSSLVTLDLSLDGFTGIPTSLFKLKALTTLNLGSNNISGGISNDLGTSAFQNTLTTLDLSGNQLTGNIPDSISKLTNLNTLSLQKNQLTGNIPASFGQLTKLLELNLNDNRLNGPIPDGVANLKVTKINLSNNELSGTIPLPMCQRTYNLCDLTRNQLAANARCASCQS